MTPLSDAEVEALGARGYFVRDGFLGAGLAAATRAKAVEWGEAGVLKPAGIRRGGAHRLDAAIRGDRITWISEGDVRGPLGDVWGRFDALMDAVNQAAWMGLRRFDLQLAHYAPGAHYDRHRDAFPGDDNRRVTAIVYLNPDWRPEHGGRLRLFAPEPIDVDPVADRLVVFLSERLEHEVLVSHADRYAATAWFYSRAA
ncbi:MAG: 2OG-Fe(II) oxygenase [Myxococcota bacterium]|jgi:SM-20-related protein